MWLKKLWENAYSDGAVGTRGDAAGEQLGRAAC